MTTKNTIAKPQIDAASAPVSASVVKTAKLFKNGRSQAVRLPKEFRFEGKEVAIRRDPATGEVVMAQAPIPTPIAFEKPLKGRPERLDSLRIPEGYAERAEHRTKSYWEERFAVWDALGSPEDDVLERDPTPPVERDFF